MLERAECIIRALQHIKDTAVCMTIEVAAYIDIQTSVLLINYLLATTKPHPAHLIVLSLDLRRLGPRHLA